MGETNVYIDGFNLYNGAVKGTAFKWLDIHAMCVRLLPGRTINRIRYFTAHIKGFPHDPDAPLRQNIFLRAIKTLPTVQVHDEGWFTSPRNGLLLPKFPITYRNPSLAPEMVRVVKYEEKRTDVDLATWLLLDCFNEEATEFVIITNDNDLIGPIEAVRFLFGKRVGVINPHPPKRMSGHLKKVATRAMRTINPAVLRDCQMPDTLADANGTFSKPSSW